ncbi:hypothetical protein [Streptomyces sp. HD]|uniref:hypothetical protein n=1 Tax=Streptomyces sp. HD TaxID=3020892 RepID=UPI00232A88AC|nr:hypothetical protein [Streptomyces sp. HD]MDC0772569.1 hypothetical protein [Streptomyces sp. HD]
MTRRSHSATPYCLPTVSLLAFAALSVHQHLPMADVLVHRAEGQAVLRGGARLYDFTVTECRRR